MVNGHPCSPGQLRCPGWLRPGTVGGGTEPGTVGGSTVGRGTEPGTIGGSTVGRGTVGRGTVGRGTVGRGTEPGKLAREGFRAPVRVQPAGVGQHQIGRTDSLERGV